MQRFNIFYCAVGIFIMQRSLQGSPFRKNIQQSPGQSKLKSNSSILSNLTQITIQTNDREIPFISIFKPDIKKQQRRVQGVTLLCNHLNKWQTLRTQFAIHKLIDLKLGERDRMVKVICLYKIISKLERRKILAAFYELISLRNKKKGVLIAVKLLMHIQAILRKSSIRNTFFKMKLNLVKSQIATLENQEQSAREIKGLRDDLSKLKQSGYDSAFIATTKTFIRTNNQALIDGLRQANFDGLIRVQIKRFEQVRFKMQPRRKQPFQNEILLIVFGNLHRSFQSLLNDRLIYQQQLKGQLQGYKNVEGMAQLNEIIRQKDSLISELQNLTSEISRVDNDLKRFTGDKYNPDKMISILNAHEKKLDIRLKTAQGIAPKIVNSRLLLIAIITSITKKNNEERESFKKQVETLVSICNSSEQVTLYVQNKKERGIMRPIGQTLARLYHQITELQLQSAFMKERELQKQQSIQKLNNFIKQLESKNYHSLQQSQAIKVAPQLQPILSSIVTLVKINNNLQLQNQSFHRQIQNFQNKYQISDRQLHSNVIQYTPQKLAPPQLIPTIRLSEQSLANHFFSPLKEIMLDHKQDEKLQQQLNRYQQSIHQMLQQNIFLQQKLVQLETAHQMIDQLKTRNSELKAECQGFKNMQKDHLDLMFKMQNYEQQIATLNKQAVMQEEGRSKASEYELKIKQLTFVNKELQQKILFIQQSNKKYNQIASSQDQLNQQMKQISKASKSKPSTNQQLLMKQTELMKQIINLKIQSETVTMNHIKQITALKNQLTSYQTIINKLEIQIIYKENQTQKLEEGMRVLQNKLSQEKDINFSLQSKVEELEEYINTDKTRKGYENSLELSKLQNECSRMYEHLGQSVDTIKAKQGQVDSLITLLKNRDDLICSLEQQKQRILLKLHQSQLKTQKAQQSVSTLRVQLSQLKNQYLKIQHQIHNYQHSKEQQNNHQTLLHQLQQKQNIINNLLQHNKNLSSAMTSQLFDAKSDYIRRQKSIQQKLSQKQLLINKLQFDVNQKSNTIRNLQSLLELYCSQSNRYPRKDGQIQSRDKEILYLSEQVKSLQQFLNDLMAQYHQLQLKYQKQRTKIDPSQLSPLPSSHKKYAYQQKSSVDILQDYNRCLKKVEDRKEATAAKSYQTLNNTNNLLQKQLSFHFKEFMASNQSLVYSQDNHKQQTRNILSKVANSTSVDWVLGLVFNILINISKLRVESEEARKIWRDLLDLKARYSGEMLFVHLQAYCKQFITLCVSQ